jgi:deoxyribodipyrimidine photolyase-like uncharacterized protein
MTEPTEAPITRTELLEILEEFVTQPEMRVVADAQAMATTNGVLIRSIMRALIDHGVLTEKQIMAAREG